MRVPPRARNSLFNPKYHSSPTSEALSWIENGNSMPRGQPKMVIRESSSRAIRQFTKLFPPYHSMESKALRPARA